jgi:hypothetical protein
MPMTLWKPVLAVALAVVVTACSPTAPLPGGEVGFAAPVASRADRTPGTLTELDIVRAVQSSL